MVGRTFPGQATAAAGALIRGPAQSSRAAVHSACGKGQAASGGVLRWIPALLPLRLAPLQSAGMRPPPSLPRS